VRGADRPEPGHRADVVAGERGPDRQPAGSARLRLRGGSGISPRGRRGHWRLTATDEQGAASRRSGGATSRRIGEAAASGLFDVLAHHDLGRTGDPPFERPLPEASAPLIRARDRGESPSRGSPSRSRRRAAKRAGEIYRAGLSRCCPAGAAHRSRSQRRHVPRMSGADYDQALSARGLGVSELCVFDRRVRRLSRFGQAIRSARRGGRAGGAASQDPRSAATMATTAGLGYESHRLVEGAGW